MEFMVAELCHAAPKLGVRRISLNFAVFRSVFEEGARIGAGPVLRLWRRLLLFFSKWWQLEALYRSNAKYHPEWYPRFLCYAEAASLARVGLASGIAEGFVSVPSMRTLWGRGRGHSKGGQRPATTEGLPSLAALGLAGGDGTEPADPLAALPDQVRIRHRKHRPLPVGIPAPTHSLAGIEQGQDVTVAGRIMLVRDFRRHRLRHAARPVRRPPARPHP
jgi:lysyl-tRNA synthetase class 2